MTKAATLTQPTPPDATSHVNASVNANPAVDAPLSPLLGGPRVRCKRSATSSPAGALGQMRTHLPTGEFTYVPGIVKRQVGDLVELIFANGAEDTAPRSDIRELLSFPDGENALFGQWLKMVSPRLDASVLTGLYTALRGPGGAAGLRSGTNANLVAYLFCHIRNQNIAARQAAGEEVKSPKASVWIGSRSRPRLCSATGFVVYSPPQPLTME